MKRILVGMSGGVDSAVAAYLLKQQGYDVVGVTLRTREGDGGQESRCCEIDDARETAKKIGIPYHVFNCISEFDKKVINPFICDYLNGLTPNPCVVCNREIKWERLLYLANVLDADLIATGHYASVVKLPNGRYTVKTALHSEKDQTYMLYRLTQDQLAKTVMPLGAYSKQEVRSIAEQVGLSVAAKPDSQEICFVTDGDYADFIEKNAEGAVPGEGNFVDETGKVLGKHKGIIHYTVGQRKGLGIALGHPAYIKRIDAERNEIVLGETDNVCCKGVICRDVNLMGVGKLTKSEKISCKVKVRYSQTAHDASIEADGDGRIKATFYGPVRSAAPGQSAVFYDGDGCVLGGGIISEVVFQ